ncbi:MAG: hypothetical protein A2445_03640 [Candidatus Jacksonbacteria bacterium RIFOXYC2_FULL_44_29]|nr:MAG: hypothetical protein UV19_C0011G0012 [Parcubacteria group bacterium GW2011_GWA2_42_28]KKT53820.1 MAG: hypothetical protein UW45_C0025G0012 [Parcubacteria group bacterium GW2011_GWC2_44_22]OGY76745.1 MAG: hypothetical protein A2240_00825 [Candidatus Jacksonbacteria bacterium RIFOXYA2_FULL_43_12]OGY77321.1 MAG: hypothetical protein A2295_03735 [Candidatus Jacksonbacteria bacterium RIFOXYB2_FULL_44_15]OGY79075.1 MAG: hypothetical protein A2550_04630 [Candidatus Jacksonbacteria bacterium RI
MNKYFKIVIALIIVVIIAGLYLLFTRKDKVDTGSPVSPISVVQESSTPTATNDSNSVAEIKEPTAESSASSMQNYKITPPIADALSRIAKKPFGIKISPQNSPISPERFSGYHTGVDFETLATEKDTAVPVYAICTGSLTLKKWVSGYGGVVVQKCQLENQTVTVIYGHLKLESVKASVDDLEISAGDQLGILGQGYTAETDGERKHLHLGIHQGTAINIRGYVQTQPELDDWLDPQKYL